MQQKFGLTAVLNNDANNLGYLVLSNYVSSKGQVYLNLLRVHNPQTAPTYFDSMANLPVIGSFEIVGANIYHNNISFLNPCIVLK